MAAKRGQGKIVTKRITRGKRKGQTVRGYMGKGGKFTELKVKTRSTSGGQQTRQVGKQRTNTGKGKRAGQKFASLRSSSGQKIHRYKDKKTGKVTDVVVKPKKDNKTSQLPKRTAPKSSGKSTVQRPGGSMLGAKIGAPPNQKIKRSSASDAKKPPAGGKVEVGLNRQKGNPRKGKISINTRDKQGRPIHIYPGAKGKAPTVVTIKKKPKSKKKARRG